MKNLGTLSLVIILLLFQCDILKAQVKYWTLGYQSTNKKYAHYFSTETKKDREIHRTFYKRSDSSKVRFEKKNRTGKLLKFITFYPHGVPKEQRDFSTSRYRYVRKTFDLKGRLSQEIRFDENSRPIQAIAYNKNEHKILETSLKETKAFFSNGDTRILMPDDHSGNFIHYYSEGTKMLSKFYRKGKAFETNNAWYPDGQPMDLNNKNFIQTQAPIPRNFSVINQAIRNSAEVRNNTQSEKVVVRVYINEEGLIINYRALYKAPPLLCSAVERFILYLDFNPLIIEEKAIPFWTDIPFYFE